MMPKAALTYIISVVVLFLFLFLFFFNIDMLMLILVLLLTVVLEFGRMQYYIGGLTLRISGIYLGLGAIGGLILLSLLIKWAFTKPIVRDHPFVAKGFGVLQGFKRGFFMPSI